MGKKRRLTQRQQKIVRSRVGDVIKRQERRRARRIVEKNKGKQGIFTSSSARTKKLPEKINLPPAKELEVALCQLVGVEGARVVIKEKKIREIHVVTDPLYFAKHIAQDVKTFLIVEYGIFLKPPVKICVVQIEGLEARRRAFLKNQKGL